MGFLTIKSITTHLKERWLSETPKIYKRIRNIAFVVSVLIPALSAIDDAPNWFVSSKWYIMGVATTITLTSQFTVKKDKEGDTVIIKKDEGNE